ncbi:MAG: hypothetical protein K0S33_3217 [Bacteroidetes bacterium]|jgi:hypothetical protein|nr:hypothetical protein [Bacteroidota bacterium]
MKRLLIVFLVLGTMVAKAQFIQGLGVFGSGTSSRHDYENTNDPDSSFLRVLYPEPHRSAERLSWGAGIVAEMLPFRGFRWQSEIEYINKGAKETNYLTQPYFGQREKRVNKYRYIAWNNFAKFRLETFNFTSSLLIGARLEYKLGSSTPAYSDVSGNFKGLWISPDVGIGFEPYSFRKIKIFTELHYNPDVRRQYDDNGIEASNRTWELRVGIMYRKKKMNDLDCNAPRYHGD